MKKQLLIMAISVAIAPLASAASFSSYNHAKMLGMGGSGVALSSPSSSGLLNPAAFSGFYINEGFEFSLPSASVGLRDEDELVDYVDSFQEGGYVDDLERAIDEFSYINDYQNIRDATQVLGDQLSGLSDRNVTVNGTLLGVISVPQVDDDYMGWGLVASATGRIGGSVHFIDGPKIDDLVGELDKAHGCIKSPSDCRLTDFSFEFIDASNGSITFSPRADLDSYIEVIGASFVEFGVPLSKRFEFNGNRFSVGLMPKVVRASVFNYAEAVDDADFDNVSDYIESEDMVNLDLGVLYEVSDEFTFGLSVKDLFSQTVVGPDQTLGGVHSIEIAPQARAGVGYDVGWLTLSGDVDLNVVEDGMGNERQVAAVGVEFDAWGFAQIRGGYRHDLVDSDDSLISAGVGLSPFGIYFDLGAAFNEREFIAAAQTGFRF